MWEQCIVAVRPEYTDAYTAIYGPTGDIMLYTPSAAKEIADNIVQKNNGKVHAEVVNLLEAVQVGIDRLTRKV